ncbi:FmdB family zinc ribbon protein [Lacisediminihabitans changchengi]|uniref:FmdB family transcriptional regulator n=1 Tax=Lacisediminihabitans changchengi TaxID=2787634 RepID=A0A934W1R3_9MICO|nr:FmdB family zinc ribbon protein [Lacisediminihabitans changchengi]MBK4347148.1 FmdB family transcriptional regulator [Lacisediminihabitans changchengi]
MPTYSYRCANCGFEFDKHQSFSEDSLIICPNCEEPTLRKVFKSIGVSFNGSGFYRNDSRAAEKGAAKSKNAAASTSDAGSSTPAPAAAPKSDAKKSETKKPSTPSSPTS